MGGGGFIGSNIADRLLQEGHYVRIFERPRVNPYRTFSSNETIDWVTGDFSSAHDLRTALEDIDVVIHLISTTLPKSSNEDPIYDIQSNVISTLQMLNIMAEKGIKKLVFISSGGTVYGKPIYLPIDEQHPTNPVVSYGISKLTIEKYLALYEDLHGINSIILRVSNPFGERQRVVTAQGAVGIFIYRALHSETIEIWGDGSIIRDYLYISDLAEAFLKVLDYNGPKRIFNISSGQGTSLNDLLIMIKEILGGPIDYRYLPGRAFDVPINILSNELAKNELNWTPKVSIKDGIERTIHWIKNNHMIL